MNEVLKFQVSPLPIASRLVPIHRTALSVDHVVRPTKIRNVKTQDLILRTPFFPKSLSLDANIGSSDKILITTSLRASARENADCRIAWGGSKMHVFIDESGSFTGFHAGSISVVGALAIPEEKLGPLKNKYVKIRARLPLEKGEVKGRLLNEWQIDEVVTLLARNEVLFEGAAIDLGMHTEQAVHDYKKQHGEEMLAKRSG